MIVPMKDSRIDIIKNIPISWLIKRLKYFCSITTGDGDTQDAEDGAQYPFYVRSPIIERSSRYTFDGEGILMAGDGAGGGRIFHHAYGKYAVHQRVYRLFDIHDINSDFLFYYISNLFPNEMDKGSAQSTVPSVRLPMLTNFPVCLPSKEEQNVIVSYLNQKCAAIDEAIDRHKKIIEKLEEYRSASISVATTHGINKNIPLKESGVDWCPRVPITWAPINPKALFSQRKDRAYEGDKQLTSSQKSGIIFQEEFERVEGRRVVEVIKDFSILKHVEPGDFVISMRSFEGGLEYSYNRGCISSAYVMLVPNHKRICSEFYKWFFKSSKYINAIQATTNLIRDGQAMRYANFISVPLFDIPIDEQEEIASYLNNLCTHIDASIQKHNCIIEKLMDYRKSIIYQAVTGKIDCRKEAV